MKSTDEKYYYYKPGEMFYLLRSEFDQRMDAQADGFEDTGSMNVQSDRYNDEPAFDEIIDDLFKMSNERASGHKLEVSRQKNRELHFWGTGAPENQSKQNVEVAAEIARKLPQPQPRGAFSIIPAEIRRLENDRVENDPEGYARGADLTNLVLELDREMRKAQPDLGRGITLEAVSLNWLASPTSEWGGGGGPGGLPEPYRIVPGNIPFNFEIPSAASLLSIRGSNRGKGVTVAILDTAPCLHDLAEAYERYYKVDPQNAGNHTKEHPLIKRLLEPVDQLNRRLHIHAASLDDLLRMRAVYLKDHHYQMTDHGLFVAGIVNTIAPEAEIHLYEVLNPYGVGDLLSIAKGLWEVLNRFSGQPLVVNCSLVLNIPRLNQPITDLDPNLIALIVDDADNNQNNGYLTSLSSEGEEWLTRQGWAIEWICNKLLSERSYVIAAAGNDWKQGEGKKRPDARFPAAFSSVLGVGALKKVSQTNASPQYQPSSYSNISDKPEYVGITTLGGEPGEKNGILGVYIGKFPSMKFWLKRVPPILQPIFRLINAIRWGSFSGPKNKNDWAWWAGTSFATPIVSGVIASVLSDQSQPASIDDVLTELYTTGSVIDGLLPTKEDGIPDVTQI
jgi:hypothetical protein